MVKPQRRHWAHLVLVVLSNDNSVLLTLALMYI